MTDINSPANGDVSALSYEAARDELRKIIQALETGTAPLEETLGLWQRGEDLAKHCRHILAGAQRKIDAATSPADPVAAEDPTALQ